jgi:hypothetical protein
MARCGRRSRQTCRRRAGHRGAITPPPGAGGTARRERIGRHDRHRPVSGGLARSARRRRKSLELCAGLGACRHEGGRSGAWGHAGDGSAQDGELWQVATPSGTVTAQQVVLATNGYTDDLWPALRRSVVPVFGAIAATAPLPDRVAKAVMPSRAVLYESGAITVYYRVDGGGRLLIGGRGPQTEISSTAPLSHLLNYARKLWPALKDVAWTHAWGGRLAMTQDSYSHWHEPAKGSDGLPGLQRPWSCHGDDYGRAHGEAHLGSGGPVRHAHHRLEAHCSAWVVASGGARSHSPRPNQRLPRSDFSCRRRTAAVDACRSGCRSVGPRGCSTPR